MPIGLPLGGNAPWEIAISVIGDIIAMRHGHSRSILGGDLVG